MFIYTARSFRCRFAVIRSWHVMAAVYRDCADPFMRLPLINHCHCPHSRPMRSRVCVAVRCLSVRLSVCPTAANPLLQVCCCEPGGQDCCTAGAQQRAARRATAGSGTLSTYVGSWMQTQLNSQLNRELRTQVSYTFPPVAGWIPCRRG